MLNDSSYQKHRSNLDEQERYSGDVGGVIQSIGESLKNQNEIADLLFTQYDEMTKGAEKTAEEILELYNSVFYNRYINKEEIASGILKKVKELLSKIDGRLKNNELSPEDKKQIVDDFINKLNIERDLQREIINELIEIISQLKELFAKYQEDIWEVKRGADLYHDDGMSGESKYRSKQYAEQSKKFDSKKIKDTLRIIGILNNETSTEYEQIVKKQFEWMFADRESELSNKIKSGEMEEQLKELLDFQSIVESKLDQIAEGKFNTETDELIMMKYKEIQMSIANTSKLISECFEDEKRHVNPEEVADELFKEAIAIISTPTATNQDQEEALKKLNDLNANVLLTEKIIGQLPREEVAKLDLKKISHIKKLEDIRGAELLNQPKIMAQIKQIIKAQFPGGDDEVFEEECNTNQNLRLVITLADNKVLSFFSKEEKSENIEYVDWFIANPKAPIKGLGEATLKLGFDGEKGAQKSYYAVAKPHAKSFQILVENHGFVSFSGSTEDGEYKHHYARVRRLPTDKTLRSKNLTVEGNKQLLNILSQFCQKDGEMKDIVFDGSAMRVCMVSFHDLTHHDDIKKTDPDGWIMNEIDKQNKGGYVLTRFIPQNNLKGDQTYYAVFEKDSASDELRRELEGVVFPESSSHSVSKKTLSN